ncbi:MAG: TfuA-like protein [Kofleriaceae bacterium]
MTARGNDHRDSVVFVGPTLPASEVAAKLPGVRVMPPVAVGDVLRWTRVRGVRRIAIIDGYFERMAAVWHKELLLALERGIAVWGASSMGALRAAELAAFGMRGVGAIFRMYARGELVADDEVAIVHLPEDHGYRPASDALVNLRHGIARAPMLSASTRTKLIELARRRFYADRSWSRLLDDARKAGLPARQLARLAAWPKPDLKAQDARSLLRTLARDRTPPPRLRMPRTWAFRQLEAWISGDRFGRRGG